jgi:hypothetical protein
MRRFLLVLIFASPALYAMAFTSCSLTPSTGIFVRTVTEPGTSSCFGFPSAFSTPVVQADASDHSFIPGGPSVSPGAWEMSVDSSGGGTDLQLTAVARAGLTFVSAGPSRSGLIQLNIELFHQHAGSSEVNLTDGVHDYSWSCAGAPGCDTNHPFDFAGTLPFTLGTKFRVDTSSITEAGGPAHGGAGAALSFGLLEADGAAVPFSVTEEPLTPEPSTWGLLSLGLSGCALLLFRRSSRGRA